MTDYWNRVHVYSLMGDFTKQQEIDEFKKAGHGNEDLVQGAERQFREKVKTLQSVPSMQQYFENNRAR